MLFNEQNSNWNNIVNQNYDAEFDYIAIDKIGQIAVFSTFNRGYKPTCVTSSLEKFLELDYYLNQLPKISESLYIKTDKNEIDFQDWVDYSSLGLFAYDNQDVYREKKLNQYDIICQPKNPLKIESTLLENFKEIIPVFNLVFGGDLKFEILEKSIL